MTKKHIALAFFILLINIQVSWSQKNLVHVNKFTGTASIGFPLYNVQCGGVSLPVDLVYNTNGVKVKDVENTAGMNWQLSAGGEITRELRGLPDDYKSDINRLGWLYNTNGVKINNFTIANDNNATTCTDEASDISYINANFSGLSDSEPDIFDVNAPGLSCKLVFDNNHNIKTIPYRDIKVTYTTDVTSGSITSFSITNDKGIRYDFSVFETTTRTTNAINGSTVSFFKTNYNQYNVHNGISYNSSWKLTKMSDPNGNTIKIYWDANDNDLIGTDGILNFNMTSRDTVSVISGGASNTNNKVRQYTITSTFHPLRLYSILYENNSGRQEVIDFSFSISPISSDRLIQSISGYGKVINFSYKTMSSLGARFLSSFTVLNDCGEPITHTFDYIGANTDTKRPGYNIIILPDSSSRNIDYWGYNKAGNLTTLTPRLYVNPSNASYERYRSTDPVNATASYPYTLTGADRSADPVAVTLGCLSKITYPEGGSTTLTYESNDFYDSTSGTVVQGGGVRVKQITDFDGSNAAYNIVRNFVYVNPTTGLSSGKPVSLPVYAFTTPYTGSASNLDLWNYSTIRSESNLSQEDNSIIYSHVRETQQGAGSTLYEFTVPATNWDTSALPDWSPTMTDIARTSCSSAGVIKNDKNTYPFPPNTNFDFERGLIKKKTNFNDNGTEVSESSFSYQRNGSPVIVTGLKFDDNAGVTAYAKYTIFTSTGELTSIENSKVFDSSTLSQAQQTTSNYFYNSSNHRLVTQLQVTNSDGSIHNSYIKYAKDYTTSPGSDSTANGVYHLQQLNMNLPIERYFQITKGGSTKTIGAELVKYNTFAPGATGYLYLPNQKLKFTSIDGITDFTPSTITGTFNNDYRYVPIENDLAYDANGYLLTKDDNNKHLLTIITDHHALAPVASFSNARYDEIAYSNFHCLTNEPSPVKFNFQSSSYTMTSNSRSGQYSVSLPASFIMSKTVNKNALSSNYIFSIWLDPTTSGNINITLTNSSNSSSNYSIHYTSNGGIWKYYELKIPVANMSSTFTIKFQSDAAVLIDDILFYPEVTEVNTYAYDPLSLLKTAETNTNGVSSYYSYDLMGRLKFIYDQDKQIKYKKSYVTNAGINNNIKNFNAIYIPDPTVNSTTQTPINFNLSNSTSCVMEGLTASWNFGDGTAPSNLLSPPTHTYSNAGNYTVTATLTSPFYGQRTATMEFPKVIAPAPITIVYVNNISNTNQGKITNITFTDPNNINTAGPFTESDLKLGKTIKQGVYNVTVTIGTQNATPAWKSLSFDTNSINLGCWPSTSGGTCTMSLDLRTATTLYLNLNTTDCPLN